MKDRVFVGVLNGLGDDPQVTGGLERGQRVLAHPFRESLPLDIVHREVGLSLVFARLMNRNNVRMLQAGSSGSLRSETPDEIRRGESPKEQQLQGNDAVETELARLVNHSHAAPRN